MKSLSNGEPTIAQKVKKNYWEYDMACCDCSLVHHIHFWIHNDELWMKTYRDDFMTALFRIPKKKKNARRNRNSLRKSK